jgi:hypothetical protein
MDLGLLTNNLMQLVDLRRAELRKGSKVEPLQVLDLSRMYRRLGCALLRLDGDADSFFFSLHRAADLYLQFLERKARKRNLDPYYLARGRAEPLLDALAAGDVTLASRIDALARTDFTEGMEYEEDFWFFTVLPKLAATRTNTPEILHGLEQLEQSLRGVRYPRYDALKALSGGNAKAFDKALKALATAWSAELKRGDSAGLGNPYAQSTEGRVFVEGIALIRVARARGLRVQATHRLIPETALGAPGKAPRRDALWKKTKKKTAKARAKQPRARR